MTNKREIPLSDHEKDQVRKLSPLKWLKFTRKLTKIFQKLCKPCRELALKNPRRNINDYCEGCKPQLESALEIIK
jgi:hypothetical protein